MDMRKLFLATAALMVMAGTSAWAEDGPQGGPKDKKGHEKMMRKEADTDGDGFLSKAEFLKVQEERFAEMDADSDGKISKEEMRGHFGKMREKMKEARERMNEKKERLEEKQGE